MCRTPLERNGGFNSFWQVKPDETHITSIVEIILLHSCWLFQPVRRCVWGQSLFTFHLLMYVCTAFCFVVFCRGGQPSHRPVPGGEPKWGDESWLDATDHNQPAGFLWTGQFSAQHVLHLLNSVYLNPLLDYLLLCMYAMSSQRISALLAADRFSVNGKHCFHIHNVCVCVFVQRLPQCRERVVCSNTFFATIFQTSLMTKIHFNLFIIGSVSL